MTIALGWQSALLGFVVIVSLAWLMGAMARRVGLNQTAFQLLALVPVINQLAFVFLLVAQLSRVREKKTRFHGYDTQ